MGPHQQPLSKKTDLQLSEVKETTLLSNTKKEIDIKEIKFVDKVSIFIICQIPSCKKKCHTQWVSMFSSALHAEQLKR